MIDWKSRISDNDKYIDIQGLPRYTMKWSGNGQKEVIYDLEIELPDMPPLDEMVNYGLPEYDQIFRKIDVPKQVKYPTKNYGRENWSEKKKEDYIDMMWHIRKNGYWCLIKNKPRYIPGLLFFKMNACDAKNIFIYRDSDRRFFTFWLISLYRPCDGVIDFKCRQLGDTENVLVIIYDFTSRMKNRNTIMQAAPKEDRAEEAFFRLTAIHRMMPYYFKPIATSEDPRGGTFEFNYPQEQVTAKKIKEKSESGDMATTNSNDIYEYEPINSRIMIGPSSHGHFDGTTDVGRAYLDEFGKPKKGFSVWEWLNVVKEALFNKILGKKTGHIAMTSTVEDLDAESFEDAFKLWQSSDPNSDDKMPDGKTVSGLWRMFRGVADRGEEGNELDRWGDIDADEIIKKVTEKFERIFKVAGAKMAYSYIRKNPRTIDDVFKSISNMTQFNETRLNEQKMILMKENVKPYVQGNLKWRDGIKDTEVVWEPDDKGKWFICAHPEEFGLKSNAKIPHVTMPSPGNYEHFSMGIDPIDQKKNVSSSSDLSLMSFTVWKNYDSSIDGEDFLYHQEDHPDGIYKKGDPIDYGMHHRTNRPICVYRDRDEYDLNENFEDAILTAVYFGTDCLGEKQKFAALRLYFEMRSYFHYISKFVTTTENSKGKVETEGISAHEKSFQEAFSYMDAYISKWAYAIKILILIEELLTLNWANKGKKDMGVSALWALYHATHKRIVYGDNLKPDNSSNEGEGLWEPHYIS